MRKDVVTLIARRLIREHGNEIKYLGRKWRVFSGGRWQIGSADVVFPLVALTVKDMKAEMKPTLYYLLDDAYSIGVARQIIHTAKKDTSIHAEIEEVELSKDATRYFDYVMNLEQPNEK